MKSQEGSLLLTIAKSRIKKNKWDGAFFEDIKKASTTEKGDIGEEFIVELCKLTGIDKSAKLNKNKRDSFDSIILNKKLEIKTATEDTNNCFQFNGIRYHRKYEFLIVLGISPDNIYFNIYNSADVKSQKVGNLVSMEKGAVGSQKLTRKKSQLLPISEFKNQILSVLNK